MSWHKGWDSLQKPDIGDLGYRGCASRTLKQLLVKGMEEHQAEWKVLGSGSKTLNVPAKNHRTTGWLGVGGTLNQLLPAPAMDRDVTAALQSEIKPITFQPKEWSEPQHSPVGVTCRQENTEGVMAELQETKISMGEKRRCCCDNTSSECYK